MFLVDSKHEEFIGRIIDATIHGIEIESSVLLGLEYILVVL